MNEFGDETTPSPSPAVPAPIDVYGERPVEAVAVHKHRQRILLPVLLFIATCITTYLVGGPAYAGCVMGILLAHELGHFVQARRYHVPASLPYFIPIPAAPLGTMGAVIVMRGHMGNRKALFDIGITGPLAGLVPALICCVVGLSLSEVVDVTRVPAVSLGSPLLFDYLAYLRFGSLPANQDVLLHPVAFAGWVGLFITALNLMPIGQLDGGHILYALLRRKAHPIATLFLAGALLGVVLTRNYGWSLMLFLLVLAGPKHPPTANDDVPLGLGRKILGWLTLAYIVVGFTPRPFNF